MSGFASVARSRPVGFTREVLFVYSPFVDLQVRLGTEIQRELRDRQPPVTRDIGFVRASDARLRVKLEDWTTPDLLLIPLGQRGGQLGHCW